MRKYGNTCLKFDGLNMTLNLPPSSSKFNPKDTELNFQFLFLVFFVRNLKTQGQISNVDVFLVRNLKKQGKVMES